MLHQLIREKVMAWNATTERMEVRQDIRTIYDLGENPTEVKFYDNSGWAYTETRSYARGHQLTDFSTSNAAGVTVSTSGSYSYDTNGNLTGTKKLDVTRGATQLAYRAEWTFTYDRKNRLKSYTNTNVGVVRGNLWYDGQGRVWQRWNDDSGSSAWDPELTRFVYDGKRLAQEHVFDVEEVESEWVYTYTDLTRDYMLRPGGIRQRERSGGSDTDYYLHENVGVIESSSERDAATATLAGRDERSVSLNQISGGTFNNISNLATSNNYVEMYGDSSTGFDALVQIRARPYLSGIVRYTSRKGNCSYCPGGMAELEPSTMPEVGADPDQWFPDAPTGPPTVSDDAIRWGVCKDCCWDWLLPVRDCVDSIGKSRQCWTMMCCNCFHGHSVGVWPCNDARYDCQQECCSLDDYESLQTDRSGYSYLSQCGGDGGACWLNVWQHFFVVIPNLSIQDYMHYRNNFVAFIMDMCRNINETGCLGLCPGQSMLCTCFRNICNCNPQYLISFYIDPSISNPHYDKQHNEIRLKRDFNWRDILHELTHYCMQQHIGVPNAEIVAYSCEKLCEGDEYQGRTRIGIPYWATDVHPCCCTDNPGERCRHNLDYYKEYVQWVGSLWSGIIG